MESTRPTDNNKLGNDTPNPLEKLVQYRHVIELRDKLNREDLLPVVATGANLTVKEEFVQIELYFVFLNNGDKRQIKLEVHGITGTHAGEVRVFRNPEEIKSSNLIKEGFYPCTKTNLAGPHTTIELKEEMEANEFWRVQYTYYAPIEDSLEGTECSFTLPYEIYQVSHEEAFYRTFESQIKESQYKFVDLEGYFLAPYEINVKEISSHYPIKNIQITSSHNDLATLVASGCTPVNSVLFPTKQNFSFSWNRVLTSPKEVITVVEENKNDNHYYFYLKAFPKSGILHEQPSFKESLERNFSDKKFYFFTLCLDTGNEIRTYEDRQMLKAAARTVLTQLLEKTKVEWDDDSPFSFSFRILTDPFTDDDPDHFYTNSEEEVQAAFDFIDNLTFSEEAIEISNLTKNIKAYFETGEETEESAHRYIFISSALPSGVANLFTETKALWDLNKQIRFYYVSVQPYIDYTVSINMKNSGNGLAVAIKDEFDLDAKIESIVDSALETYNYDVQVLFRDVQIKTLGMSDQRKNRGAYETIEYFGRFEVSKSLPPKIPVDINFKNSQGTIIYLKTEILLHENHNVARTFIPEVCNDLICFQEIEKPKTLAGSSMKVEDSNGNLKVQFEVIYGSKSKILLYALNSSMEFVKNDIINQMGVTNLNYSDWRFEGGRQIDFTKPLDAFKSDDIEARIIIPEINSSADISKLHLEIAKRFNNDLRLFEFDAKFVLSCLKIKKGDWVDLEANLKKDKVLAKKVFGDAKDVKSVIFSYYCIFYLNSYLKSKMSDVEEQVEKVKKFLKAEFGYSESTQKEFNALVTFKPSIF